MKTAFNISSGGEKYLCSLELSYHKPLIHPVFIWSRTSSASRSSLGRFSSSQVDVECFDPDVDSLGGGSETNTNTTATRTRHWIDSVSDIYGPDEIDELLQDLNRLELAAEEDFDIDGSQLGTTKKKRKPKTSPTLSVSSWDSHAAYHDSVEDNEDDAASVDNPGAPGSRIGKRKKRSPRKANNENSCHDGGLCGRDDGVLQSRRFPCFCDTSVLKKPDMVLRIMLMVTKLCCR